MPDYEIWKKEEMLWLNKHLFTSATTREAQTLAMENRFEGTYVRHLSTGHAETQWVNLLMLCFAERCGGFVGTTLRGLTKGKLAQKIIGLPAGRILYEVLEEPHTFKVSVDEGVVLPDFTDYLGIDTWEPRFLGGRKFVPDEKCVDVDKQAEKIAGKVYVQLQPFFVAQLGSVDLKYGPLGIDELRKMATERSFLSKVFNLI